jgi:hypothetical protein
LAAPVTGFAFARQAAPGRPPFSDGALAVFRAPVSAKFVLSRGDEALIEERRSRYNMASPNVAKP